MKKPQKQQNKSTTQIQKKKHIFFKTTFVKSSLNTLVNTFKS
jgi:hypothetical protein